MGKKFTNLIILGKLSKEVKILQLQSLNVKLNSKNRLGNLNKKLLLLYFNL